MCNPPRLESHPYQRRVRESSENACACGVDTCSSYTVWFSPCDIQLFVRYTSLYVVMRSTMLDICCSKIYPSLLLSRGDSVRSGSTLSDWVLSNSLHDCILS